MLITGYIKVSVELLCLLYESSYSSHGPHKNMIFNMKSTWKWYSTVPYHGVPMNNDTLFL